MTNISSNDTLYNSNAELRKIYSMSHEIDNESFQSFQQAGWCQTLQDRWSSAIEAELGQIAAFDPRPMSEVRANPSPVKEFYSHITKKWAKIESSVFPSFCEVIPEISSTHQAKDHVPGQSGVDIRPHLYDAKSKTHILVDSGSQISAWPPDPSDTPVPNVHLKAVNGSQIKCYGHKGG